MPRSPPNNTRYTPSSFIDLQWEFKKDANDCVEDICNDDSDFGSSIAALLGVNLGKLNTNVLPMPSSPSNNTRSNGIVE